MIDFGAQTRKLIMSALRKAFARSNEAKECRKAAIHPTEKGKRGGVKYTCAMCGNA